MDKNQSAGQIWSNFDLIEKRKSYNVSFTTVYLFTSDVCLQRLHV